MALPEPAPLPELLTTEQVADLFQITPRTLNSWRRRGVIAAVKIGGKSVRFRRADVEALIDRSLIEATQ